MEGTTAYTVGKILHSRGHTPAAVLMGPPTAISTSGFLLADRVNAVMIQDTPTGIRVNIGPRDPPALLHSAEVQTADQAADEIVRFVAPSVVTFMDVQ